MADHDGPSQSDQLPRTSGKLIAGILVIVGAPVAVVLGILWSRHPGSDTVEFEAVKACLQVLAVGVIGAAVGAAIKGRDDRVVQARRIDERRLEERQQAHDRRIAARQREDDFLMDILNELLDAYHAVKRARRLLDAETRKDGQRGISIESYDRHMGDINNQQLRFERLARLGPLCDERAGRITGGSQLNFTELFRMIEKYLNDLVGEYQKNRHAVMTGESFPVTDESLPHLYELVAKSFIFKEVTSQRVDKAVKLILELIRAPIGGTDDGLYK